MHHDLVAGVTQIRPRCRLTCSAGMNLCDFVEPVGMNEDPVQHIQKVVPGCSFSLPVAKVFSRLEDFLCDNIEPWIGPKALFQALEVPGRIVEAVDVIHPQPGYLAAANQFDNLTMSHVEGLRQFHTEAYQGVDVEE